MFLKAALPHGGFVTAKLNRGASLGWEMVVAG
jgi:hypothetical protein